MEDNKKKKRLFRFIVLVAIIIPVVLAISYAYFQAIITGEDLGVTGKSTNTFDINLVTENDGYINATNLILIRAEDVAEEAQKGYFKVVSGDNKHYVTYTLSLSELTISSNLQVNDFKWQLLKNNQIVTSGTFNGVSSNSMNLAAGLTINANLIHNYELRIWLEETDVDQLSLLGGTFSAKVTLIADMNQNPVQPMLRDLIIAQGGGASTIEAKGNPNFASTSTPADTGLYAVDDEYGTSYYYRGEKDLLNNNLIFGGFQWKIVRINGDGSVRILYNGTEAQFTSNGTMNTTGTNTTIGVSDWCSQYCNDAKYIGYMYGGANGVASTERNGLSSSAATYNETSNSVKIKLDTWYQTNILGKTFENKIVDNIFCNDRRLKSEVGGAATGPGYGNTISTYYAGEHRLLTNKNPILKCGVKNDRFTTDDTTLGNGHLTYPIGLITAEEASMAGANSTNYLNIGQRYWTSTPSHNYASPSYTHLGADMWNIYYTGGLVSSSNIEGYVYYVRPVLNLSSETSVTGDGSATNPYQVV